MASQVVSSRVVDLEVFDIYLYVRGYHAYMDIWTPIQGQTLLVRHEPTNSKDNDAGAVYLKDTIVGHLHNLAPRLSKFFAKRCEQGLCRGDWRESQPRRRKIWT